MVRPLPQSVLFCCDHNAVRSPMAEGIMKKFYGTDTYVQSVGVKNDLEIDGRLYLMDDIESEADITDIFDALTIELEGQLGATA